jgi:predicted metalloprotease with PDZ domain
MKKLYILFLLFSGCATPCTGVIGAQFDTYTNLVDFTFDGSPAESAGIKTGDELLYPFKNNGEVGTTVTTRWIRNDVVHTATLKRVCVDDLKERKW